MAEHGRFTTWLSAVERRALENVARDRNQTVAYLIRMAVRKYLGLGELKKAAIQLVEEDTPKVAGVTGNKDG